MVFVKTTDAKGTMLDYEGKFRKLYPDARCEEETVSSNMIRYHVIVGGFHCSESAMREYAFKYALDDIREGKLKLPPQIEQLHLWPVL